MHSVEHKVSASCILEDPIDEDLYFKMVLPLKKVHPIMLVHMSPNAFGQHRNPSKMHYGRADLKISSVDHLEIPMHIDLVRHSLLFKPLRVFRVFAAEVTAAGSGVGDSGARWPADLRHARAALICSKLTVRCVALTAVGVVSRALNTVFGTTTQVHGYTRSPSR